MLFNHIILAMLWIVYCVLHSVLASEWVKKRLKRSMADFKWYRLWYSLFAFVFLVVLLYYQVNMKTIQLFGRNDFILVAGILVCFSGLLLMAVCIRKYFMNLSGLRNLIIEDFSNELQITGVHRYVRHPLYLGTFAFIWGLFLLFPYLSLLLANSIITLYTLIGIELEEKKLLSEFGESYARYREQVPKLIPFFRAKHRQKISSP